MPSDELKFKDIDENTLQHIIKNLRNNKASDLETLSNEM